jgi:hypothetical protein
MADEDDDRDEDEEEAPPPKKKAKKPAAADDDDAEDEGPKKSAKKKPKRGEDDDDDDDAQPKKKGGSLTWILLGVGGVGVLLLCCCGGPVGYMFYADATKPKFVGDWEKAGNWKKDDGRAGDVEFGLTFHGGGSGLYNNYPDGLDDFDFFSNFRWKAIDDKTIEITRDKADKKFWFGANKGTFTYAVAGDELTLTNTADKQATKLRKVINKK